MNKPSEKIDGIAIATGSAMCRYLRNKQMYIPVMAGTVAEMTSPHNDQTFYWCNKTLAALGQDDERVHPCACKPERGCYEA
jgi:hypothetical protein